MPFQIRSLEAVAFSHLFSLDEQKLAAIGAEIVFSNTADERRSTAIADTIALQRIAASRTAAPLGAGCGFEVEHGSRHTSVEIRILPFWNTVDSDDALLQTFKVDLNRYRRARTRRSGRLIAGGFLVPIAA